MAYIAKSDSTLQKIVDVLQNREATEFRLHMEHDGVATASIEIDNGWFKPITGRSPEEALRDLAGRIKAIAKDLDAIGV